MRHLKDSLVRKAFVSDVVHSFCWACRHNAGGNFLPLVILGFEAHVFHRQEVCRPVQQIPRALAKPFLDYWYARLPGIFTFELTAHLKMLQFLEDSARNWSLKEWQYATQLLYKYYTLGAPNETTHSS